VRHLQALEHRGEAYTMCHRSCPSFPSPSTWSSSASASSRAPTHIPPMQRAAPAVARGRARVGACSISTRYSRSRYTYRSSPRWRRILRVPTTRSRASMSWRTRGRRITRTAWFEGSQTVACTIRALSHISYTYMRPATLIIVQ
jgi:hypothetical protein